MITGLGPQVAIVDDREEEVQSIEQTLNDLNIGNKFFKVDYLEPEFPAEPLETVELLFLDLHYNTNMGADFNPDMCADWISRIISPKKKYALIVWSRDTDLTEELLETMQELQVPMPFMVDTKQKNKYQTGNNIYDIKTLLAEVNSRMKENKQTDIKEFFGEVIDKEEGHVLINCLMDEENPTFQVRRFDIAPLEHIPLEKGTFIKVRITTELGIRKFEFFHENRDMKKLFIQEDLFIKLKNNPIINGNSK